MRPLLLCGCDAIPTARGHRTFNRSQQPLFMVCLMAKVWLVTHHCLVLFSNQILEPTSGHFLTGQVESHCLVICDSY